jgi:hypothetical protein
MRSFLLALSLLPTQLCAEGAVQSWACSLNTLCGSDGYCFETNQSVIFTISPVDIRPDGSGEYMMSRGGDTYPMRNVTGLGPFLWSEGEGDREVLLLTGETTVLWQRFKAGTNNSDIGFLSCETTQ